MVGAWDSMTFCIRFGINIKWWRNQMETFYALLALCAGNSPVSGEFSSEMPVTRSFDVFCDLRLNTRLNKQSRHRRSETPSRSLWRHSNDISYMVSSLYNLYVSISMYVFWFIKTNIQMISNTTMKNEKNVITSNYSIQTDIKSFVEFATESEP